MNVRLEDMQLRAAGLAARLSRLVRDCELRGTHIGRTPINLTEASSPSELTPVHQPDSPQ